MLKLRFRDPATLSELDLMRATRHVFEDREALGPDRLSKLLMTAKDRLGMDFGELAAFAGLPVSTLFSYVRAGRAL